MASPGPDCWRKSLPGRCCGLGLKVSPLSQCEAGPRSRLYTTHSAAISKGLLPLLQERALNYGNPIKYGR